MDSFNWDLMWGTAVLGLWYWFVIGLCWKWGRSVAQGSVRRKFDLHGKKEALTGWAILAVPFVPIALFALEDFEGVAGVLLVATAVYVHGLATGRKELPEEDRRRLVKILRESEVGLEELAALVSRLPKRPHP